MEAETTDVTMPIIDNRGLNQKYNLTICAHGSLRKNFSDTRALIEWFETYLILGADKFAVYNHSGSSSLKPLIDYYVEQDVLDFYDISAPQGVKKFNEGQKVIIQDCIYRYMYKTKYLALIDFDEYFIPMTCNNIFTLLDSRADKDRCGHFQLLKYWFCTDCPSTNKSSIKVSFMATYTKRTTVSSAGKYIIQPQRISYGRVHSVFNIHGYRTCHVRQEDGYVHHYRRSDSKNPQDSFLHAVNDTTAIRYLGQLMPRLMQLLKVFPKEM